MMRVVVTGSECTGKTTLARDLARHYSTVWTPEHARTFVEEKKAAVEAADVEAIARGQLAAEDDHAARARGLLVLDTDLVSTVVYARHYYGRVAEWIERAARERLADLYLLAAIDVAWKADGVRDRPAGRSEMHRRFRSELKRLGARVVDVSGSQEDRLARAVRAIDRVRTGGVEPPA